MIAVPTVRRASEGDAPRCAAIVFAALEEHGIVPEPEGLDRDVFAFGARGGRFRDLVAVSGGRIVGIACLEPWDDKGWLSKLFVDPEARGRGVGRLLLGAIVDEARAQGMTEIGLTTRAVFASAIRLYEAFGFERAAAPARPGVRQDLAFRFVLVGGA